MKPSERKLVLNRCIQLNWQKKKVFTPVLWNSATNSTQDQMPVPFSCNGGSEYFYSIYETKDRSFVTFASLWRSGPHVFNSETIQRLFKTVKIDAQKSDPKSGRPVNGRISQGSESIRYCTEAIDVVDASIIICTYNKITAGEYHAQAKKLLLSMSNFGRGSFQSFPSDSIQF